MLRPRSLAATIAEGWLAVYASSNEDIPARSAGCSVDKCKYSDIKNSPGSPQPPVHE